jgi:acetate kinase
MSNAIAVFNAGSSSLKFSVFEARGLQPLLHGQIEGLGSAPHLVLKAPDGAVLEEQRWGGDAAAAHDADREHEQALTGLLERMPAHLQGHALCAAGHRIVHGGARFTAPVQLDAAVLTELAALTPLAPLHQPHNLAPVEALARVAPTLPQVGCFDTAFHTTNPPVAQRFALPRALHDAGVRRYGFHGLSYEYIASQLPGIDAWAAQGRTIVLHLGNGASACALHGGHSVASTMGFTALEGLMMGTRSGSLDAGVLLWLMDERGMGARQIEHLLYSESGLLGVSGLSADMRTLLASDRPEAREAVALYTYRIQREIGSLAAALGGLDAIVFTAGIGEHAAPVREAVCQGLAWLGVRLDEEANARASGMPDGQSARISVPGSPVTVWVVPTDEERMIARHTRRLALPDLHAA